jgi:hypothetical protein
MELKWSLKLVRFGPRKRNRCPYSLTDGCPRHPLPSNNCRSLIDIDELVEVEKCPAKFGKTALL